MQTDILILNTGGPSPKPFITITEEDWNQYHNQLLSISAIILKSISKSQRWGRLLRCHKTLWRSRFEYYFYIVTCTLLLSWFGLAGVSEHRLANSAAAGTWYHAYSYYCWFHALFVWPVLYLGYSASGCIDRWGTVLVLCIPSAVELYYLLHHFVLARPPCHAPPRSWTAACPRGTCFWGRNLG